MEKSKGTIRRIAAIFYKDFQWKLLSIALAFLLWVVGINVNDPLQLNNYQFILVNVLGRDQLAMNQVVLLNEHDVLNRRVDVSVRAIRSNHAIIQADRSGNIQAFIDLGTLNFENIFANTDGIATVHLDVNVNIHQDYTTRNITPPTMRLDLDRYSYRSVPIVVDVIGTPREGYEQRDPSLTQTIVRLTGAQSALNEVADVRMRVYIDDAYETVEEMEQLIVYNSARENITNTVNLSTQHVHVRVPIFPYWDMPLEVSLTGSTMSGYMVTETIIDPPSLELVGNIDASRLNLVLGEIDLSLTDDTVVHTFDIRQALVGTGLTLKAGAPSEATVTVVVEQIMTRNIFLPVGSLRVSGIARPYSFVSEGPIRLEFWGRESVINHLGTAQVSASLDLTGLGAGTHILPVRVAPITGASLANFATVEINIEPEPIIPDPEEVEEENLYEEADGEGNGEDVIEQEYEIDYESDYEAEYEYNENYGVFDIFEASALFDMD